MSSFLRYRSAPTTSSDSMIFKSFFKGGRNYKDCMFQISKTHIVLIYTHLITYMPVELKPQTIKWLKSLQVISAQHILQNSKLVLSYNDQMYLQNGYLVAQILKNVLKASGSTTEGLLRVRKIAYISSNENWRILKDILEEIGFQEDLDPEEITVEIMQGVIEFLCEKFSNKPQKVRKERINNIDIGTFQTDKSIQSSRNLLQFLILALSQSFQISLNECLGLLVENGRYLCQAIILGTNDRSFEPVMALYQNLIRNINVLNRLLQEQYTGSEKIMNLTGLGVLSESHEVCQLTCLFLDAVDSDWPQQKGVNVLIKSPHSQALDLLMRRLGPKLDTVFNVNLSKRFEGKYLVQIKVYTRLLKYAFSSLYGKEMLKALELSYYIGKGFDLFQPDRKQQSQSSQRTAVRYLLSSACRYFHKKITISDFNKLLFCFEVSLAQTTGEKLTAIAILCDLLHELIEKNKQWSFKLFRLIWKYYEQSSLEVKTFVIDNLEFFIQMKPEHFPFTAFLELHQPNSTLQSNELSIFLKISEMKDLPQFLVEDLLKTSTIYYYQQLSAGAVIEVISNLIRNYQPLVWSREISQQILTKWPSLQIPPYQPLPPTSKKIKYRSVGLKKKQMMQFTQLNRYKNMLLMLVKIRNKGFLQNYYKAISSTISKVEKSKVKQMSNTKIWLNNLLALIDASIMEMKEKTVVSDISEMHEDETLIEDLQSQSKSKIFEQYGRVEEEENQFMKEDPIPVHLEQLEPNPLLPFSEQNIESHLLVSEPLYFENYELIFLRALNQRHANLLSFLTKKYKASASLSHFFKTIHISPYIEKNFNLLEELNNKLTLSEDNPQKIVSALMVQSALLSFEFKKSRRVTIRCVESFYQLLLDKNQKEYQNVENEGSMVRTKVEFQWILSGSIKNGNSNISHYLDCFEVVSELLEKAIGISQVQPLSKTITQVEGSFVNKNKSMQYSIIVPKREVKELEELQKIIQSESQISISRVKEKKSRSSLRKKQQYLFSPPQETNDMPERWAEVQKRVIMRRRQLESKFEKEYK